jgi:hypothetical protein
MGSFQFVDIACVLVRTGESDAVVGARLVWTRADGSTETTEVDAPNG